MKRISFCAAVLTLLLSSCGNNSDDIGSITRSGRDFVHSAVTDVNSTAGISVGDTSAADTVSGNRRADGSEAAPDDSPDVYDPLPSEDGSPDEAAPEQTEQPAETPVNDPSSPITEVQQHEPQPAAVTSFEDSREPVDTPPHEQGIDITDPQPITDAPDEPAVEQGKLIDVRCVLQNPELPTGCEITSLTILLNHLGYGIDKVDLARNYLPKQDFYYDNGQLYGADFVTTFAGNPENNRSYGCYAPCIVTAANSYLVSVGSGLGAYDRTGSELDSLFTRFTDNGIPVLIWITSDGLLAPRLTDIWLTPDGRSVQWLANEHCVVLTGYDSGRGKVFVSDPIVGNTAYDLSLLRTRYNEMGRQCVSVE